MQFGVPTEPFSKKYEPLVPVGTEMDPEGERPLCVQLPAVAALYATMKTDQGSDIELVAPEVIALVALSTRAVSMFEGDAVF